ncbi:MAG: O-methyltransferase [Acidimicrobiia bacterium]
MKQVILTERLADYLTVHASGLTGIHRELVAETARLVPDRASMQVPVEQAVLLGLLAKVVGARRALEVGTFTGLSALCVAQALPDGGRLLCCDVNEEWTAVARRYWELAGVADKVDLRIGPAAETLAGLPEHELFDFAFIDADKTGYPDYWELIVPHLRPGGLLVADNVLWGGRVAEPDEKGQEVEAIRAFNDRAVRDTRMETVVLPLADGVLLARKR